MRRSAVAAVLAAAALLLGACQGSGEDAGTTAASEGGSADQGAVAGTMTIFAAASLQAAFTDVITAFEEANPEVTVESPVYDGSSTLVTQLVEGAEADVFAAADEATMADLVDAGLNDAEPQVFTTNTLVIAVEPGNPLEIADLADLDDTDYVVCAPEVPCGNATTQLFELSEIPLEPVSQEQNVTAVAERVLSGEVDAGLVYATDVASRADLLEAVVPSGADQVVNSYPITTLGGADPAAVAFVDFVLSDDGQAILAEHGFGG